MMGSDGVFTAAETWKCKKCRKVYYPGSSFLIYSGGAKVWYGCMGCAGVYKEIVEDLQKSPSVIH